MSGLLTSDYADSAAALGGPAASSPLGGPAPDVLALLRAQQTQPQEIKNRQSKVLVDPNQNAPVAQRSPDNDVTLAAQHPETIEKLRRKNHEQQQTAGTPPPPVPGKIQSEQEIEKFWISQGYPPAAAKGIARRAIVESGGNAAALGDYKNGVPTSRGIWQFHAERNQAQMDWAKAQGLDPDTPDAQNQYAALEMDRDMPGLKQMLMKVTDPTVAYNMFTQGFERPKDPSQPFDPSKPYEMTAQQRYAMEQGQQVLGRDQQIMDKAEAKIQQIDKDYKPIDVPPLPKPPQTDPLATFSSLAGVFATLAAGFSRTPAIAAMNGLAGAMEATKKSDWEGYKANYDQYKTQSELAIKAQEMHSKNIHDALEEMQTNMKAGHAHLEAALHLADDEENLKHLRLGDFIAIGKRNDEITQVNRDIEIQAPARNAYLDLYSANQLLDQARKAGAPPEKIAELSDIVKQKQATYDRESENLRQFEQASKGSVSYGRGSAAAFKNQALLDRATKAFTDKNGHPPDMSNPDQRAEMGQLYVDIEGADKRAAKADPNALLGPDELKPMVDAYIAGDKSQLANLGRGAQGSENITRFRKAWAEELKARGMTGQDQAAAFVRMSSEMREAGAIGTRVGAIAVSGAEAKRVASLVTQAYDKLPREQFRPYNQLVAMVQNKTNSPEQAAARAADFAMVTAYARALNPSGIPRVTDIQHGEELLSLSDSHESHAATVNQMLLELDQIEGATGDARNQLIDRIRGAKGFPPPGGGSGGRTQWPAVPPQAVDDLRKAPDLAAHFDEVFGPGAAAKVLGH